MLDLLFDTPWWLPTSIIALGLFVFLQANRRTNATIRLIGMIVIGCGLLLAGISYLVDTPREKVIRRSKQFVQAVVDRDWPAVESLLAPDVQFISNINRDYPNRDALIASARMAVEDVGLTDAFITDIDPRPVGGSFTAQVRIFSSANKLAGQQVPSDWELEWQKRPDQGWVMTRITLRNIGSLSGDPIRSNLDQLH